MNKKFFIAILSLVLVVVIYFLFLPPTKPALTKIPTTSLEKSICEEVSAQFGDCKKIILYDTDSNLVFVESSSGIIPVLTNKEFTEFNKFIYPMLDFQEFKEEKEERGSISWQADQYVQKDLSIIYGFAEDNAKSIVIHSEGNIQPNRFLVRDNLWVWYTTFQKDKVKLPVKVTVYDDNGQIINGSNEKSPTE